MNFVLFILLETKFMKLKWLTYTAKCTVLDDIYHAFTFS